MWLLIFLYLNLQPILLLPLIYFFNFSTLVLFLSFIHVSHHSFTISASYPIFLSFILYLSYSYFLSTTYHPLPLHLLCLSTNPCLLFCRFCILIFHNGCTMYSNCTQPILTTTWRIWHLYRSPLYGSFSSQTFKLVGIM